MLAHNWQPPLKEYNPFISLLCSRFHFQFNAVLNPYSRRKLSFSYNRSYLKTPKNKDEIGNYWTAFSFRFNRSLLDDMFLTGRWISRPEDIYFLSLGILFFTEYICDRFSSKTDESRSATYDALKCVCALKQQLYPNKCLCRTLKRGV